MPTYTPKASEIQRAWYVVDAEGLVLGRLATEVARMLRGKHKPTFTPHLDTGDHVIVVNADKVVLTSDKAEKKIVYRHSGYPGGLKTETYAQLLAPSPKRPCAARIRGMLPKTRLGRQMLTKLKVYAGPTHPARRPAAAAPRPRPRPPTAERLKHGAPHAQAPRPDHRPPQAGRRPRPGPPRHRHDHHQRACRSRTTSRPRRTG